MIRIGVAGLGTAGRAFLPAIVGHRAFKLAALADPSPEIRAELGSAHGVETYADLERMLGHPGLDAICIATPTQFHAEHALASFAAGKHVLVEKPMATSLADGRRMMDAGERAGKVLLVGHSHSYDPPIVAMRRIVEEGSLGAARMVNTWCFTDWIYRPRRAEELDISKGGGVTFRQGAHQFDIMRLLCGGSATSVRAKTFSFDASRDTIGAHVAFVDFADGAAGSAVYNGYGNLPGSELTFNIGEWGFAVDPDAARSSPRARASAEDELKAKARRAKTAIPAQAPHPPMFGLTILACERGDVRQTPKGLAIHTHERVRQVEISTARSPRDVLFDELERAIDGTRVPLHDGRWALATLELSLAAMESSRQARELTLHHQVAVPAGAVAA